MAVLRDRLRGATRAATVPAHAAEFAKELFDHRSDFSAAVSTLRGLGAGHDPEVFIAAFRRTYVMHMDEISQVEHRTELLSQWIALLTESLSVVRDELDAPVDSQPLAYHELFDEEDLEIMAIDREDDERDVVARGIAEAWHA